MSRSFMGLLITQFLGAMNDNMFRFLVIPIAMLVLGKELALALGTIIFTLPYLLFANRAGFLADRFDKRVVIVSCKVAEIILMALGLVGLALGSVSMLFLILMAMGIHSALFGPAKFGSIPEIVRHDRISAANGVMGLVSVVSTAGGTFFGSALYELHKPLLDSLILKVGQPDVWDLWPIALALVGTAVVGTLASLPIQSLPAANPERHFSKTPFKETWIDLKYLANHGGLFRAALGISFFWMLASLVQSNIYLYGESVFHADKIVVGVMLVILVVGVALGSALAGVMLRGRIELGLVPLGVVGIIGGSVLLCIVGASASLPDGVTSQKLGIISGYASFWWSLGFLFVLGVGAGMFNIPLESFLQGKSDREMRGTVIAGANFLAFSMMIVSALLFYFMSDVLKLSSSQIFLMAAVLSVPVLIYAVWLLPYATVRFVVWIISLAFYRLKVLGRENIPEEGGALLVCNHVSRLDGPLLLMASPRPVRIIADADFFKGRLLSWIAKVYDIIPLNPNMGPKGILNALKTARDAIENGELVCIFPEGELTKTGQLGEFHRGLTRIIQGSTIPVIPINLGGLWGSIFSYSRGRLFWKKPTTWPYRVTVRFGEPMIAPDNVFQIRQVVEQLGVDTVEHLASNPLLPARRFLRRCRRNLSRVKVADSSGGAAHGRQTARRESDYETALKAARLWARGKHDRRFAATHGGGHGGQRRDCPVAKSGGQFELHAVPKGYQPLHQGSRDQAHHHQQEIHGKALVQFECRVGLCGGS